MPEKLKILYITGEYPPITGGIGSYIASLAPALASRGHKVHVLICVAGQEHKDYMDQGIYIHCRGEEFGIPYLGRIKHILRLTSTINRFQTGISTFLQYRRLGINFDVIEYPDYYARGWLLALPHKIPLVCMIHAPFPLMCRYHEISMDRDKVYASYLERFAVHHADVVTSPSQITIKELKNIGWLKGRDIEIIPNPVDFHRWSNIEPVQNTKPVVLFLGRANRLKAPEVLVEAMFIIRKEITEAKALFIGESNEREGISYIEWIKKTYKDIDGCQFIGQVPRAEVRQYISKSRVLAMPSRFENFSMAGLEAMAAGRPIVVTSKAGLAEFVKHTGTGRVIPPKDPNALAEALLPFLRDAAYAAAIGETARLAVIDRLDPDKIAEQREAVYLKAISSFNHNSISKASYDQRKF